MKKLRLIAVVLLTAALLLETLVLASCGGNTDPDKQDDERICLYGAGENYSVIYPGDAAAGERNAVDAFLASVKERTGIALTAAKDSEVSADDNAKEILLGATNRTASENALRTLGLKVPTVSISGNQIVVLGSDVETLTAAAEKLADSVQASDGKLYLDKDFSYSAAPDSPVLPLTVNGEIPYKVILPSDCSYTDKSNAEAFTLKLKRVTGQNTPIAFALDGDTAPADFEICVGSTNRAGSDAARALLKNENDYAVSVAEKRIYIAGTRSESLNTGMNAVLELFQNEFAVRITDASILSSYVKVAAGFTGFPGYPDTCTKEGTFDCGNGTNVTCFSDVTEQNYTDYIAFLNRNGAETVAEYFLGEFNSVNLYALLRTDSYSCYVSYLPMTQSMRVYLGSADEVYPSAAPVKTASVTPAAFWQLEVDTYGAQANGGMSYVLQLTDGTFLVIDGGYNTKAEGDNLVKLLQENKPASHEKPIVAAWLITHLHVDHYGAVQSVAANHASDITVNGFYYNFLGKNIGDIYAKNADSLVSVMKAAWPDAVQYSKLHSGMKIPFPGAEVSVICTYEDVYPHEIVDGNDTSVVFKITVGGQSILILGDARTGESDTMETTIPTDALDSDFMQMAHHGYEGCNQPLYRKVNPEVVLWPMNSTGWEGKSSYSEEPDNVIEKWHLQGSPNSYIWNSIAVTEIILSGAGTRKLALPYAVPGTRTRPDLDAIYAAKKKEQQINVPNIVYAADTSWYNSTETGKVFTLTKPEELLGFAKLREEGKTFLGQTIRLGADMDLNPGWSGKVVMSADGSAVQSYPAQPKNIWPNTSKNEFQGIFDGQGHTVSGVYLVNTALSTSARGVSMFGNIGNSGSASAAYTAWCQQDPGNRAGIRNTVFTNGFVMGASGNANLGYLSVAGLANWMENGTLMENVWCDFDVWSEITTDTTKEDICVCGIVRGIAPDKEIDVLRNVVFAGKLGGVTSTYSKILSTSPKIHYTQICGIVYSAGAVMDGCMALGTLYLPNVKTAQGTSDSAAGYHPLYQQNKADPTATDCMTAKVAQKDAPAGWVWNADVGSALPADVNKMLTGN